MEAGHIAVRDAYGESLLSICRSHPHVYVVDADNSRSTRTLSVREHCPNQFIDVGSAEQNLLGVAAGVALMGKRVFASTFSSFIVGRSLDVLKSGSSLQNLDVVVTGTHSGLSGGELGWSHHMTTDLAVFLSLPNFRVMVPADAEETREMVASLAQTSGPAYLRVGRGPLPVIVQSAEPFDVSTPRFVRKGKDIILLTYGASVHACIQAADELDTMDISCAVLEIPTLKPLEIHRVADAAGDYGAVMVVEEHHGHGGLGSVLLTSLIHRGISCFDILAIPDIAPRSLPYEYLLEECGLTAQGIIRRIQAL